MLINPKTPLLDFDDISIMPANVSHIDSRSACNVYYETDEYGLSKILPLIASPMDTVVKHKINGGNAKQFLINNIDFVIPRSSDMTFNEGLSYNFWNAISIQQFRQNFIENNYFKTTPFANNVDKIKLCIDIANGHMSLLLVLIARCKELYGDRFELMVGNIANPETFKHLSLAGADYVRVGIGGGSACTTATNTGIYYPMASLLMETFIIKEENNLPTKIIADGGMRNYSDIIKALAIGSDYVMVGSLFNKALESAGNTYREVIDRNGNRQIGEKVNQYDESIKTAFKGGARFYKSFRGMSTKDVQRELGNTTIRTAEGITTMRLVEYTLDGWVENFIHYLSSAMSYTNKLTIEDFIGGVDLLHISKNSFNRIDK